MRNFIVGVLALVCIMGCSVGGGIDKGEVQKAIRAYYSWYPYMLGFPEDNTRDSIRFGGHDMFKEDVASGKYRADIKDVKILDVGKQRNDKSVAVKCLIIGQYADHDKTRLVEKEVIFVVAKDDFNKTTLQDEQGLRKLIQN